MNYILTNNVASQVVDVPPTPPEAKSSTKISAILLTFVLIKSKI